MASTALYLKDLGYVTGEDWGYEVIVPDGFDLLLATRETLRPVSFFADKGVTRVAGRMFPDADQQVFLYLPAGISGPAFLMTRNYLVFKAHNFADSYALAVAHLTDRLKGAGPFIASWPRKVALPDAHSASSSSRRSQSFVSMMAKSMAALARSASAPTPGSRRASACRRTALLLPPRRICWRKPLNSEPNAGGHRHDAIGLVISPPCFVSSQPLCWP